jgi:AraC-like DNA-binding protein
MLEVKFTTLDPELEEILKGIKTKFEDQDRQLFSLLSRLVLEGQRKALNYKYMSGTLLMECLLLMYRICMKSSIPVFESLPLHREARFEGAHSVYPLDLVDEYINAHLEHPFTMHDMAIACGYNQDYLYRVIKKRTGLSAIKYVNLVKFEKALFLIQNTEQSLSEIGWHLGFENLQYFSRFFRHHSGITPSEYIAKVRLTTRTDY